MNLEDKKVKKLEKQLNAIREELKVLRKEKDGLRIEIQAMSQPLSDLKLNVQHLQEISNLAGENGREGDYKLAKQRRDTIQAKFDEKMKRIKEIDVLISELEKTNPGILHQERVRRWLLAEKEIWRLRAQALDKKLSEDELKQLIAARKAAKIGQRINTNRIIGLIDTGRFKPI